MFGILTLVLCVITILPMYILVLDSILNDNFPTYLDRFVGYFEIALP